jgi:hypothetical protein
MIESLGLEPPKNRKKRAFCLAGVPAGIGLSLAIAFALAGSAGAGTAKTAVVPSNTSPPTISGTATEGQVLTVDKGTWSGTEPITYTYEWQRCDSNGGSCSKISGSTTATTYTLKNPDVANTLRVAVTATNADGTKTATSVPTAVVKAAATTTTTTTTTTTSASNGCATNGGTVAIAGITAPAHLSIDQFQVNPSRITYSTRSLTARFHVSACGGSVQGALVYVTAVPYGMFAVPNEQTTGADGWASVDFRALSGFPVSQKQQLLVMFVRARKSGEDILGGISSRRLVSFKVSRG